MNLTNIKTYKGWKKRLIMLAVKQFGYDRKDITEAVESDGYLEYYESEETPFQALQLDERNEHRG